jgi:hypothetical protein
VLGEGAGRMCGSWIWGWTDSRIIGGWFGGVQVVVGLKGTEVDGWMWEEGVRGGGAGM